MDPLSYRVAKRFTGAPGRRFVWKEFLEISKAGDLTAILMYARRLPKAGEGSSRRVYLLSGKKVLKVAKEEMGQYQNKNEVKLATTPGISNVITKVYDFCPYYTWIVSELARPLTSGYEWEELAQASMLYLFDLLHDPSYDPKKYRPPKVVDDFSADAQSPRANQLILNLRQMAAKVGPAVYTDLDKLSSWGKTQDGRLVLLDYGYF